jgi:hypothetical protein
MLPLPWQSLKIALPLVIFESFTWQLLSKSYFLDFWVYGLTRVISYLDMVVRVGFKRLEINPMFVKI